MSNPKDDEELAKAIEEHTIRVDPPPASPPPAAPSPEPEESHGSKEGSGLGKNLDDFQLDVPPPEGIAP